MIWKNWNKSRTNIDATNALPGAPGRAGSLYSDRMKTIGLIGGIDADATVAYYQRLNAEVQQVRHLRSAARCIVWSFDYAGIERLHKAGDRDELTRLLTDAAVRLEAAGADLLLICSVTHHDVAEHVQRAVSIPLLHVADSIAEQMKADGTGRAGLLDPVSTGPEVYIGPLSERHGFEVLVPTAAERAALDWASHLEFAVQGDASARRKAYRAIMARMAADGAGAILIERTAFMPDLWQTDCPVPLYDTIALHAAAAAKLALAS